MRLPPPRRVETALPAMLLSVVSLLPSALAATGDLDALSAQVAPSGPLETWGSVGNVPGQPLLLQLAPHGDPSGERFATILGERFRLVIHRFALLQAPRPGAAIAPQVGQGLGRNDGGDHGAEYEDDYVVTNGSIAVMAGKARPVAWGFSPVGRADDLNVPDAAHCRLKNSRASDEALASLQRLDPFGSSALRGVPTDRFPQWIQERCDVATAGALAAPWVAIDGAELLLSYEVLEHAGGDRRTAGTMWISTGPWSAANETLPDARLRIRQTVSLEEEGRILTLNWSGGEPVTLLSPLLASEGRLRIPSFRGVLRSGEEVIRNPPHDVSLEGVFAFRSTDVGMAIDGFARPMAGTVPARPPLHGPGGSTMFALLGGLLVFAVYSRLGAFVSLVNAWRERRGRGDEGRKRILEVVGSIPGACTLEIAERAGLSRGATRHHLSILVRQGRLERRKFAKNTSYFLPGQVDRSRQAMVSQLRSPALQRVLEVLRREATTSQSQIARGTGMSQPYICQLIRRLQGLGLVEVIHAEDRKTYRVNEESGTFATRRAADDTRIDCGSG